MKTYTSYIYIYIYMYIYIYTCMYVHDTYIGFKVCIDIHIDVEKDIACRNRE